MKPSANRHVKNALVNILGVPGLGSVKSGRIAEGLGQLVLMLTGCGFLFTWFYKEVSAYYALMFGDAKHPAVAWMGFLGGALFVIAWLWSCVTSLSLFREAAAANAVQPPVLAGAPTEPLDSRRQAALRALPAWKLVGRTIVRTYEFTDFPAAMKFVNAVAALAEQVQHHPAIDVRWNKVTLALTTHDAGGLTDKDFALARECDLRFNG
jgi:4a-hydroxytetrahydrobiopterin dehydratase